MNVRGAEGDGVRRAPESVEREREGGGERRGGAGQRVRIEALVAVGETSGGGFEAESIDMSPEGMRLRTAYLPKVGDALICRFDGLGKELVVEGEVCWRAEQARGGEFGLRFTGLDAEAEETVRAMCASMDGGAARPASELAAPAAAAPAALEAAQRGARVRLHIDGLGSPMKARVRGGGADELEVGSNLEFLKVGRTLELEEVERGTRREAYIDHVKVEIDPATSVPQLVVSLRYDAPRAARASRPRLAPPEGQPAARTSTSASQPPAKPSPTLVSQPPAKPSPTLVSQPAARTAPADDGAPARPSAAPPRVSTTPARPSSPPPRDPAEEARSGASAEPDAGASGRAAADDGDDQDGDLSPAPRDARAGAEAPSSASDAVASSAQDAPDGAEAEAAAAGQPSRLRDVGEKAAKAGKVVAGKLGPALAGAGSRAASAMAGVVARIRSRRAAAAAGEGAGAGKDGGARRTTAPPPAGALKSGGRRLVREEADAGAGGEAAEPQRFNPKAAALGSFLGLATVLVLFGAARLVGLVGGGAPSGEAAGTAESAPALPAASGAPALAAAAAPAAAGGALTANVPLFGATPLSTTEPVPPTPPASSAQADDSLDPGMPGGPGDEDADEDDERAAPQEWGRGVVRSPTVLRLKMDGPIEEVTGAAGAMGFTVSLPDRRALSSGSGLARKDKRIASVRVVNTPHGAEVTLKFKDGVPAYRAKARGDRLEIAIGRDEPKKVASKSKKEKDRKKSSDDKKRDKDKER
ncbi:hypothetical protein SOCEGT47_024340 [Sorangium cellulosum]|uniref:PilZ domain-containing protein n=1 Tax=Sorangium cellulosum TaxID=56 RepID=A0A4P2PZA9_SORCE|nr:PilZ domain-containing protein [Sorangium cellulosum]AUX21936.1 hypothetical protein SOCEGT47_024340 [Sorangium cellulosum]